VSAILTRVTGMSTAAFAERAIFRPLGIRADNATRAIQEGQCGPHTSHPFGLWSDDRDGCAWMVDRRGLHIGGFGLHLTLREMAAFGYLYLHGGRWDENSIVPPEYVRASTQPQSSGDGIQYGYFWWVPRHQLDPSAFFASGYGGQYIDILPALDVVIAIACSLDQGSMETHGQTVSRRARAKRPRAAPRHRDTRSGRADPKEGDMGDTNSSPLHMPSGEIVFDQIVQRTSRLFDERTAQNTRASFVLGSASVFLGIVAGGFSAFATTLHAYREPFIWGLVVEAVLFLAGIYFAGTAYADDDVIDIDPASLTAYYERPEEETRAYIADALLRAYARDRAVLSRKKRRLVVAVRCFLAQIAWLAVLLVVAAIVR